MTTETDFLRGLIDSADNIVAFTGAGISTESGIPDFRGPDGVWTKNPRAEQYSTIQNFKAKARIRKAYWDQKLEGFAADAVPNSGHEALAQLWRDGKLTRVITQNIDGLHHASGIPGTIIDELHGSMRYVQCMDCGREVETGAFFQDCEMFKIHPADVECYNCKGLFKPGVVMFGEMLNPNVWAKAEKAAMDCDLMLVLGSSLEVYPAAGLVEVAQKMGRRSVIVNLGRTNYDVTATLVINEPLGEVLTSAVLE